jgi:hypothetical protein
MAKVLRENQGDDVHSEWVSTTGPQAWGMAEFAHEQFDKLSGVSADHRARSDLIRDDIFHTIEHMLVESGWKDIVNLGNKFIAHSADAYSRGLLPDRQTGFSLDQLSRCHRAICRAAATISGPILWEGVRGLLPTPQFDPFEHLDAPWISPKDMAKLSDAWDVHAEKVEEWTKGILLE